MLGAQIDPDLSDVLGPARTHLDPAGRVRREQTYSIQNLGEEGKGGTIQSPISLVRGFTGPEKHLDLLFRPLGV